MDSRDGSRDNTGRVGNISASSSISTMDSRDGSRDNTMDSYSVGNIGDAITMVDRGSIANNMSSIAKMTTISNTSISKTVSTITISSIESSSLRFSLSLTLGNMDNTGRVCNIPASSSVSTMDTRNSSRSNTMDPYSVGNIGDAITMVDRGSIANNMSSIAKMTTIP